MKLCILSGVVSLNTAVLLAVDLEVKLEVGSRGTDHQVVREVVVGLPVGASPLLEFLWADPREITAEPTTLFDKWAGVGRRCRGIGAVKRSVEDQVRQCIVLPKCRLQSTLDNLVALQVLALINVPVGLR
jgi:hypothetical protein